MDQAFTGLPLSRKKDPEGCKGLFVPQSVTNAPCHAHCAGQDWSSCLPQLQRTKKWFVCLQEQGGKGQRALAMATPRPKATGQPEATDRWDFSQTAGLSQSKPLSHHPPPASLTGPAGLTLSLSIRDPGGKDSFPLSADARHLILKHPFPCRGLRGRHKGQNYLKSTEGKKNQP